MTIFVRQNSLKLMELFNTIIQMLVRYQMDVLTGENKSGLVKTLQISILLENWEIL